MRFDRDRTKTNRGASPMKKGRTEAKNPVTGSRCGGGMRVARVVEGVHHVLTWYARTGGEGGGRGGAGRERGGLFWRHREGGYY